MSLVYDKFQRSSCFSYTVHSDNSGSLKNQRVPLANSWIKYFRNES